MPNAVNNRKDIHVQLAVKNRSFKHDDERKPIFHDLKFTSSTLVMDIELYKYI